MRAPATVRPMSFQEIKTLENEILRLEKPFMREKDWNARALLADRILGHCRRLADLEKRAFVSNKIHSEEWIERFLREQDNCVYMPLEEQVAALSKVPFSAGGYDERKKSIEDVLASIIERQRTARDASRYGALLERLWEISVAEDENFDSHQKLTR